MAYRKNFTKLLEMSYRDVFQDRLGIKCLLLSFILIESLVMLLVNQFTYQYQGLAYLHFDLLVSPVMLLLLFVSLYVEKESPRLSFLFQAITKYYFIVTVVLLGCDAIQVTPFSSIEVQLFHADQWLGFNSISLMNWTFAHPFIHKAARFVYKALDFEIMFVAVILGLMQQRRSFDVFVIALLVANIIGFTFYYFFPSTDPTQVLHSSHFTAEQKAVWIKFNEIHHYRPITTNEVGMIGFPSFHVIWAIIFAYALKNKKYIFYPLVVFNLAIIASTLLLGWHLLVDLLAGIVVAVIAIVLAEYWSKEGIKENRKLKAISRKTAKFVKAPMSV